MTGVNKRISLEGASIIPQSEYKNIANNIVTVHDGKTYKLHGSLVVEVYNVKTGKINGTYDVKNDYSDLTSAFSWGASTLSDFTTMKNALVTYQAPKAVNAMAIYCSQDRATVFQTLSAQQLGAPEYVFPYETASITFSNGSASPAAADWEYHGLQWVYSPTDATHLNGSQVGQASITETFTSTSPAATYYFYWKAKPKTGSITVVAVDASTGMTIPSATVSLGKRSGSSGKTFDNLPFGTYSASAGANGYYSGSGSGSITQSNPNITLTVYLNRIPPADLTASAISPTSYKGGQTVITTVVVGAGNTNILPGDNVTVRLSIPELSLIKDVSAIVISSGTSNIAAFSWETPEVNTIRNITITATVDHQNVISESNESNNTKSIAAVIKPIGYESPIEYRTYPAAPGRTNNDLVTWTEQRYEGGGVITKSFWARLSLTASINYNTQSKGYMRSGYGFEISVKPIVTTNYDKPELITGAQTAEVYLPQYRYIDAITLMASLARTSNAILISSRQTPNRHTEAISNTYPFGGRINTTSLFKRYALMLIHLEGRLQLGFPATHTAT
jgi:hypothetical protein